jgi:hypothetical protein
MGHDNSFYIRAVWKLQFPNNNRLKNDKKRGFRQKSAFFGRLAKQPTGLLNKSIEAFPKLTGF